VVGPGGWLQLSRELLAAAGIGRRAHARAVPGGLMLTPASGGPAPASPGEPPAGSSVKRGTPARVELRSLTRGYHQGSTERRVIDGLGHVFAPGRMTAVTGRPGAGKPTLLGLTDRAEQRVERLSAGEAQRVALARALAGARGLLVVDEPTSRLDEAAAIEVAELLAAAAAEDGQTVICASHDPAVIRRADHVLALGVSTAV